MISRTHYKPIRLGLGKNSSWFRTLAFNLEFKTNQYYTVRNKSIYERFNTYQKGKFSLSITLSFIFIFIFIFIFFCPELATHCSLARTRSRDFILVYLAFYFLVMLRVEYSFRKTCTKHCFPSSQKNFFLGGSCLGAPGGGRCGGGG